MVVKNDFVSLTIIIICRLVQLCYYDSKKKEKCHGVITLTDEDSVEQGDPQIVPGLKPSENGYFFNVSSLFSNYIKIDAELC